MQSCAKSDQCRGIVTDGGTVRDVTAHGRSATYLDRSIPSNKLGVGGVKTGNRITQIVHCDHGTNADGVLANLNLFQVFTPMQKYDLVQRAQLFGNPQPHIRGSGDEGRVRICRIYLCERIARCRNEERIVINLWRDIFYPHRDGHCCCRLCGANDRGIAGTATQVSGQLIVKIGASVQMGSCHGHDKTGRAKAALTAVMFDHRILYRVQSTVRATDAFDGAHGFAMQLWQKQNAGIQRPRTPVLSDHD